MRRFLQLTFLLFILLCSASFSQKGHLVIIGGGERAEYIMQRIVELAGGKNARILVIPNASSQPIETGAYQSKEMLRFGAAFSDYIICTRETADADSNLKKMDGITGVFFSGGDQSFLTRDLLGTKLLDKVYELYNNGGLISGTSAGAAVMSEIMLTGNELVNKDSVNAFISIQKDNIEVKQGFGFVKSAIIDQHFLKRKRHNRLISVVLEHPQYPGVAIDEETSIVVYPDDVFEVLGENQVLVFDATRASNITVDKNGNLSAENIKLHVLSNGDKCNLKTREIISNGSKEKL